MVDRQATMSPFGDDLVDLEVEVGEPGAERGHDLLEVRREARTERLLVVDAAGGDGRVGVVDLAAVEHPLEAFERECFEIVCGHVRSLTLE